MSGNVLRSDSPKVHVRELEKQLRQSNQDPGLAEHIKLLRRAWNITRAKKVKAA